MTALQAGEPAEIKQQAFISHEPSADTKKRTKQPSILLDPPPPFFELVFFSPSRQEAFPCFHDYIRNHRD